MRGSFNILVGLAMITCVAGAAAAKDRPAAPSPLIRQIDACRTIADPTARLACFDKSSAALIAATQTGDVSVVDRAQLREARKSLFGFNMPRLPFFAGDKSAEDDKGELATTIVAVKSIGNDHYRFRIAEGNAMWETSESYTNFTPPKAGQKVVIKRGPLGSYFIKIDGQLGVKGRRIE